MQGITDQDRVRYFDAIFADWLGGLEVLSMLAQHRQGVPCREIAERHAIPLATAHRRITAAKVKLRRVGLIAPDCQQPEQTLTTNTE